MGDDEARSGVAQDTMYEILTAFLELDCRARTTEIADYHAVSVSEEQVKTAMRLLQDWGYVESVQDGIYQYWVPLQDEWVDEALLSRLEDLTTQQELREIRRDYLE